MLLKKLMLSKALLLVACTTLFAQNKPKKAVFIIVDGISADTKESVKTPNLDLIAKTGGYSRAYVGGGKGTYSETPTISAVGYNSLLTGTWANKHNVWDNKIDKPNYHYWTIFRLFSEQYPARKTAVFSSWLDNRTKLVGEGLTETGKLRLTYSFDGLELDTVNRPHDKDAAYMHQIDEKVVDEAAAYLENTGPDLTWVYLEYTDDMGHKYGDSEQFHKAVGMMDAQIGRLWKSIQLREKQFNEDWQIFITTDHGRDAQTGKGHGGQSDRERSTWIVTNAKGLNTRFKAGVPQTTPQITLPAIVDIMPTMARHLDLNIPKEQLFELDGVPLTGKISIAEPVLKKENNQISISWTARDTEGGVKIWAATTNHFREGGRDLYYLMGEAKVTDQKAVIDVSKFKSGLYKIVLEGKYNTVNRWIVEK
ncbi:alkaline phosphatase family protein [Dyadobacter sandarakinus]|uniref:Alkaline phosphatase family protein n=1 Tax=Dyadobacter sandarakinus TaxID=2747268 RepID=A0ABX7ICF7_9BACT|nr:alkaline phosphatase family protein [Dyadobacter sandarakinus]QRR03217.1 alkaline phosphatase family protein [Dyadobacter sandarakinus]